MRTTSVAFMDIKVKMGMTLGKHGYVERKLVSHLHPHMRIHTQIISSGLLGSSVVHEVESEGQADTNGIQKGCKIVTVGCKAVEVRF